MLCRVANLALDLIDVDTYYDLERLRPKYKAFAGMPLFIMTSDAQLTC
jgi:hypothetical protein